MESRPNISAAEYELALRVLIRNHQQVYLPLEKRKTLKQLKLMEDEYGILRCQGRLGNANLPFDTRRPILVATKSDLARLIILQAHSSLHCSIS
ncbi:unnamed protein product, partial [Heligmosomoides polygyrus]|uniref:Uncharacterized protein n=1 Tax=Heligmosomoides polygyrus TaxID=6339 RepID=A0A183FCZ1_HELPZ